MESLRIELGARSYPILVGAGLLDDAGLLAESVPARDVLVVTNTTVLVVASYWLPVLAAKLIAIVASFLVNFSMSHFVVFRRRDRQVETSSE